MRAILVHGMWSTPDTLQELKDEFCTLGFDVAVPRLPFHFPKTEMNKDRKKGLINSTVHDYVQAVLEEVNKNDQDYILVGHSMGGLIAQLAAAKCGSDKNKNCKGLILVSSAAPAGINAWRWSVVRTFGRNLLKMPIWQKLTQLSFKNIQYGIANTLDKDTQKQILELATYESGRVSWQIGNWYLYKPAPTAYDEKTIPCPVLMVAGQQDKITPIELQRQTKMKLANNRNTQVELFELAKACHWTIAGPHLKQVMNVVTPWLKSQQLT